MSEVNDPKALDAALTEYLEDLNSEMLGTKSMLEILRVGRWLGVNFSFLPNAESLHKDTCKSWNKAKKEILKYED